MTQVPRRALRLAFAIIAPLVWCVLPAGQSSAAQPEPQHADSKPVSPTEASSADTAAKRATLESRDVEAWLDGYMPYALKRGEIAGVVVSIVKDGEVLLKKGYGYADVANARSIDPDTTLMRVGSVSKLFTWTAVMQLVESGKIDLDKDINQYLDFRVPSVFGKPVTTRDLMAHRGGFEEGLKSVLMTDPKRFISTERYLKDNPRPMVFRPGEVPAYSNYGAALAGYIVERVSGEPFDAYIEKHILAPLGMTHSTFQQPLPARWSADLSKGYMNGSEAPWPFELVTTAPAGSLTSTAADMAKFMLAYLQDGGSGNGRILRAETFQEMQREQARTLPGFSRLSYGFIDEIRNGRRVIGHGGDTILFHNEVFLLPEEKVGIFFSFNSRGAEDSNYAIRSTLFDEFMNRYFPRRETAPPAPTRATATQDAAHIAGRYESSRRIETAFLSLFYLLDQTVITANPDGTINVPVRLAGKIKPFRETGPDIWTEVGGERQLALQTIGGRRAVIESDDPTSILQEVPLRKSSTWNIPAFVAALIILLVTVIQWPLGAWVRRHYRSPLALSGRAALVYAAPRIAAVIGLGYLIGWVMMLRPILGNHLDVYDSTLDPMLRLLQFAGLVLIVAAAAALWSAWHTLKGPARLSSRIASALVALAMLQSVWIAVQFHLIGLSVSY
ncbi:MAG: serine hydrolase domain-containing protein [Gammaproteobacteria bacterium]